MFALIKTSLISGLRSRSFYAVILLGLMLIGIAYLAANFSPRQPQTVALDVGCSAMRIILVLMALFWVQELLVNEIDRRTITSYLTYPIPRAQYLLGRFGGILLLLLLSTLTFGLLLWLAVLFPASEYEQGRPVALGLPFWGTLVGLWLDVAVVTAFAILLAAISTVNILPLALGLAFAIAGSSLGTALEYLRQGADGETALVNRYAPILESTHRLLPDLSRLDWRDWALYDLPIPMAQIAWSTLMACSYIVTLIGIAIFAFNRREFN